MVVKDAYGKLQGEYECGLLCDLLHTEGAEVIAEYGEDFYQGMPSLTRNVFGSGEAYYVASDPESSFLDGLVDKIAADKGIEQNLVTPEGVEVSRRVKDGISYLFVLNFNKETSSYDLGDVQAEDLLTGTSHSGTIQIEGRGVQILQVK